jgi:hypothetical protein
MVQVHGALETGIFASFIYRKSVGSFPLKKGNYYHIIGIGIGNS